MEEYPDWWDDYDYYLQEKADRDYEIAMALQPERELEEQLVLDEMFPNEQEIIF